MIRVKKSKAKTRLLQDKKKIQRKRWRASLMEVWMHMSAFENSMRSTAAGAACTKS